MNNENKNTILSTQKGLNVLSLFDGMCCGMLALLKAEIPVNRYVAYEIDKYAIQTSKHNFPEIEEMGDVFNTDFSKYKGFDLIIGGSPCTYWSIAQKNNRETEASGQGWELFMQYVRALKTVKPKFFVYENNKSMSKAIRESITKTFGFEPICINSALVSAQNRNRLYWVGYRNNDGTYKKVDIKQPEDKGILLKHILKSNIRIPNYGDNKKFRPLNAYYSNNCGGFERRIWSKNSNKQQVDLVVEPIGITKNSKSHTIKAQYFKSGNCHNVTGVAEPIRIGSMLRPNGELSTSQAMRIYSIEGKSVNLTSGGGGMSGKTGLYAIPIEFEGSRPIKAKSCADGKTYTVYEVRNGLIVIKGKEYPIKLLDGFYIIRKLTVSECKRLQTVPEWYEFPVSDSQAYKMLGNGWTVDVIAHILGELINE